jgi:hypothetical protein
MVERKRKKKTTSKRQKKQQKRTTPVRATDEPSSSSSSSSVTVDPTTLTEKEESQLKEAIKKAMLDEKGQNKGYFTIGEVTSSLIMLSQTNWTESKVERVIQEWYDSGRLMEREGIGKYMPA